MVIGIPNYRSLDRTGEAQAAAERMEARAQEPASEAMFQELVAPLLGCGTTRILEVGCGTGALARRIAKAAPSSTIFATDKSEGMLQAARSLAHDVGAIRFASWDVTDEAAWPFDAAPFDLIVSSVMVPYLDDAQTEALVHRLSHRLARGGVLAFVEQDLLTDSLNFPSFELFRRIEAKDERALKPTLALGLRPSLRSAGLTLFPRKSFLWTDDVYGPYAREMLLRTADDARRLGRITHADHATWIATLDALATAGDFYYGLVYHRVAGARPRY